MILRASALLATALIGGFMLGGCGSESASNSDASSSPTTSTDTVTVTNAWMRPAPEGGVTALYFEFHNPDATADTLTRISTPVSERTEIHTTVENDDGTTGMRELDDGLPLPADTVTTLHPGGPHVMIYDVDAALTLGDTAAATLHLSGTSHDVSASVRSSPPQ
ncbi:MAG: copper chaperone PCu(A)C [Longimonas sp.]|uniref:copper chaperone PCu(A)C n=1 Tax=Longimonas sp. TaxID=2039626 RepID=UPI00397645D0